MKKSKLLTLGLLAGAGLLLSINQAQAADTWVKNGSDWNLSQDGSLAKNKWVQNAGSWYYFDDSGNMQTGWLKDGDTWYSLADSGAMRTGWYKEGSTWYSLADSGAMRTGWYKEGSTWYSLKDSGAMATGWATANGQWSYFEKSGAMVADRAVPASDGESYVIGKDGYLLTKLQVRLNNLKRMIPLSQILLLCLMDMIIILFIEKMESLLKRMPGISNQSLKSFLINMGITFPIRR